MRRHGFSIIIALAIATALPAEEKQTEALAAAAQNPPASLISLPFQNNTTFGGNDGDYTARIQVQFMFPK